MTGDSHDDSTQRLMDLLADEATVGLTDAEQAELDRLAQSHPEIDRESFQRCAAVIDLALAQGVTEKMPAHLRQRIVDSAPTFQAANASPRTERDETPPPTFRFATWSGWVAAAACLALAAIGWLNRPIAPQPSPSPQASEIRSELLASGVETVSWVGIDDFGLTEDPHPLEQDRERGDVTWSDARQQGVMRLTGLEVNDPSEFQYQLWVFDAKRGGLEQHPVDGGVFDVDKAGEVLIPIDAKIPVDHGIVFAITKEPPGGSVVSDRDIVVLAQVSG